MPRHSALLTLAFLSACDSATDPGATNRVFRLTRADSSVLVFTGTKVSLRRLFAATDIHGAPVADAVLTCALPPGFARDGDSLVAPAQEARGTLTCSATTSPRRIFATYPVDAMTVTAGTDLRTATWRVAWACTGGSEPYNLGDDQTGLVQEVRLDGRITEIRYRLDGAFARNWDGMAPVVWHGRQTLFREGRAVRSDSAIIGFVLQIWRQAPDTLIVMNGFRPQRPLTRMPRVAVPGTRRYSGADFCRETQLPVTTVVMEEVR